MLIFAYIAAFLVGHLLATPTVSKRDHIATTTLEIVVYLATGPAVALMARTCTANLKTGFSAASGRVYIVQLDASRSIASAINIAARLWMTVLLVGHHQMAGIVGSMVVLEEAKMNSGTCWSFCVQITCNKDKSE